MLILGAIAIGIGTQFLPSEVGCLEGIFEVGIIDLSTADRLCLCSLTGEDSTGSMMVQLQFIWGNDANAKKLKAWLSSLEFTFRCLSLLLCDDRGFHGPGSFVVMHGCLGALVFVSLPLTFLQVF
jgi:hypothetical protein